MHKTVHAHTVLKYAHMNIGFMTDRVVARHPSILPPVMQTYIDPYKHIQTQTYMDTCIQP